MAKGAKPEQGMERKPDFYRNNFRRACLLLFISIALNLAFAFATYFFYNSRPPQKYFATTGTGLLVPMRATNP